MQDNLADLGLNMCPLDDLADKEKALLEQEPDYLHINPMQISCYIVINLWLSLKLLETMPHCAAGYIINLT